MSKNIKAAILRARHINTFDHISDEACIQMLMTHTARTSVLNYWEDNTYGYLDFTDSEMFQWVDIEIDSSDVTRETQVAKAYEATKALVNHELDGFDIFIVLIYPGEIRYANPAFGKPGQPAEIVVTFDGGAGPVANNKPACAIPVVVNDHTFMCHETGHTLGFQHSYGLLNYGENTNPKPPFYESYVYGDPYDLMSSASFGWHEGDPAKKEYESTPAFSGASPAGWPVGPQIGMGPAPARAHVYLWDANAIPEEYIIRLPMPGMGQQASHRIFSSNFKRAPQLIIVDPTILYSDGTNRCFIEYRTNKGWDAGLDIAGTDIAQQAVVVHTSDTTSDGLSTWYRGQIKIPLEIDADVQVPTTPLTITVINVDPNFTFVDVEISTFSTRQVIVDTKKLDNVAYITDTEERKTACGDTVHYGTLILESTYTYSLMTFGYGADGNPDNDPFTVQWKVGGLMIAGASTLTVYVSGVPYQIIYSVDPVTFELKLSSNVGDAYSITVDVTVKEADGSNEITQTVFFNPPGQRKGYTAEDIYIIGHCLGKNLQYVQKELTDLLVPVHPNYIPQELSDRINALRLLQLANRIAETDQFRADVINELIQQRFPLAGLDISQSHRQR